MNCIRHFLIAFALLVGLTTLFVSATPLHAALITADGAAINVVDEVDILKANLPDGAQVFDLTGAQIDHYREEASKLMGPAPWEFNQAIVVFSDEDADRAVVYYFFDKKLLDRGFITRNTFEKWFPRT